MSYGQDFMFSPRSGRVKYSSESPLSISPQGERSIFVPPYEGGSRSDHSDEYQTPSERVTFHTVKILCSHPALEEINTHQSHPSQSPQTEFDTHLSCQPLKGSDLFFFLPTREDRGG